MTVLEAFLYGALQGVAEFLPISSSGHLALMQNFFSTGDTEQYFAFNILLHFGTLVAVFIMYRKDVLMLFKGFFGVVCRPFAKEKKPLSSEERLFLMICLATLVLVPATLIADGIEALSSYSWAIGCLLLLNGCMLFVSDKLSRGDENLEGMSFLRALYIGLFQIAGLLPGISRSGVTITGGLFNNLKREDAIKFSFLMSIPAILGANVLELISNGGDVFKNIDTVVCAVGGISAMVFGLFAIKLLQFFAKRNSFTPFAVYSLVVGALAIVGSIIKG